MWSCFSPEIWFHPALEFRVRTDYFYSDILRFDIQGTGYMQIDDVTIGRP